MKIRMLILLPLYISATVFTTYSYAAFSYHISEYTQSSGVNAYIDSFSDGVEPPAGSISGSDYNVLAWSSSTTFGPNRESGGLLELNSDDAEIGRDGENLIGAYLTDPNYYFNSNVGGFVKGAYEANSGFISDSVFGIAIDNFDPNFGNPSTLEDAVMGIYTDSFGRIHAVWGDIATINELDITSDLTGISDITMLLDINTSNQVSAMFDYGSDGFYDLIFDDFKTLSFTPGDSNDVFSGEFVAFEASPVPLPSSILLLGSGAACLRLLMRKKKPDIASVVNGIQTAKV